MKLTAVYLHSTKKLTMSQQFPLMSYIFVNIALFNWFLVYSDVYIFRFPDKLIAIIWMSCPVETNSLAFHFVCSSVLHTSVIRIRAGPSRCVECLETCMVAKVVRNAQCQISWTPEKVRAGWCRQTHREASWCQAKFLTHYCLSVILLLRVKECSLVIAFLMCLD